MNASLSLLVRPLAEAAGRAVKALRDLASQAWRLVDAIASWHRRRMLVDPMYPSALLAIAKAVISIAVPRAVVAAAIVTLIVDVLGLGSAGGGWDDRWRDDY